MLNEISLNNLQLPQMQKILFLITKSEVGGAQKFVKEQIDITSKLFDVYLCTNQQGWLTEQTQQNIKGLYLDRAIEDSFSVFYIFRLRKYIKQNGINLVVTNSANAGFYGRLAAYVAKVPVCYVSHGWSSIYKSNKFAFALNKIEYLLSKITATIVCVCNNDYVKAIERIKISPDKLLVITNATTPAYQVKNNSLHSRVKILSLTRFDNPKRIDIMIKAFAEIDNAHLFLAGNGIGFSEWKKYVEKKPVNNVSLLGEIPSFSSFHEYDAFLLISDSEGLPISAIEAMSAGLPLILSNVGGCPELINGNGVLVENNVEAIKKAIDEVINNYEVFHKNSLKLYGESFNLNKTGNSYLDLYKKLLS